jgi:predicted RNA-binding Zn ribbon-like protein
LIFNGYHLASTDRLDSMATNSEQNLEPATPLFIGDALALDFVNTAYGVDEEQRECLGSDAQVFDWLRRSGLPTSVEGAPGRPGALLKAALALRKTARELLEKRKTGSVGDVTALNRLLALGSSHTEVVWSKRQGPRVEQRRRVGGVEALMVPVAESLALLLTEGDFAQVRKCESADCTLWFHDHTNSHRRRWCSMAQCGNRMKVAAFRARRKSR